MGRCLSDNKMLTFQLAVRAHGLCSLRAHLKIAMQESVCGRVNPEIKCRILFGLVCFLRNLSGFVVPMTLENGSLLPSWKWPSGLKVPFFGPDCISFTRWARNHLR